MKTTVEISDALLERARRLAQREGTTIRSLIEESLRKVVAERERKASFRLRAVTFGGEGLDPAFADASWDRVRDAIYEGRGT